MVARKSGADANTSTLKPDRTDQAAEGGAHRCIVVYDEHDWRQFILMPDVYLIFISLIAAMNILSKALQPGSESRTNAST